MILYHIIFLCVYTYFVRNFEPSHNPVQPSWTTTVSMAYEGLTLKKNLWSISDDKIFSLYFKRLFVNRE